MDSHCSQLMYLSRHETVKTRKLKLMFNYIITQNYAIKSPSPESPVHFVVTHHGITAYSSGGSRISRTGGVDLVGGHGLPRQLRFESFVCQNERIWTLGRRTPGTPPISANAQQWQIQNFQEGTRQPRMGVPTADVATFRRNCMPKKEYQDS